MSATPDSMLADPERLIADLQRQLAELQRQFDEALARETATAEVLQVINSSPGVLAPVFDTMLERATLLSEGVTGVLWTVEGERVRVAAAHGFAAEFIELLREHERPEVGPAWPLRQIIGGERVVHIVDVGEHDLYQTGDPLTKAGVEHEHIGTFVLVALVKDGVAIGAFSIGRREVRQFSDKQIALLQNFAAQAVIAIENARLLTETREALEQQTAAAEVLQVINSSPGVLAPVFDAMLEKATRLCGAASGVLWTYDGEYLHAAAFRAVPAPFAEFCRKPFRPHGEMALGRVLQGERLVMSADLAAEELYQSGNPLRRAIVDLGRARSAVTLALRKDDTLLGIFTIYRQEAGSFSDKQIALLQNFAAQAVIAMENARLLTETREALEQQTATAEVLGVINSSPGDLTPVFDAILEKAHTLCGAAQGALVTFDGEIFRASTTRGLPEAFAELLRNGFRPSPNSPQAKLSGGEDLAHIADVAEVDDPTARRGFELAGIRTVLYVALRKDRTLLGYIAASRREVQPFSDKQIALLRNFAAQAVIAMENARLLGELRARTDEIAGWNRELEARVAEQVEEPENRHTRLSHARG